MSFKYKASLVLSGLVGGIFLDYITGPSINTFGTDFIPSLPVTTSAHISGRLSSDSIYENIDYQVQQFINQWNIAGASIAVAKEGKLVFAKGYGLIDKKNKITVEPYNLFRVASISKLITATGIMKLVEDGKLKLDDKVFGPDGILNRAPFDHYIDIEVEDIEILNLLNHTGGWTTRGGDPMFMPHSIAQQTGKELPLTDDDIIEFMLSKRLYFKPGTMAYYSNLGYVVLGKVIEEVTGQDYQSYIKTQVLYPLGIFDMQLGSSFPDERLPLESNYYEPANHVLVDDYRGLGEKVPSSYGGNDIHALGAAGGWVASSTDLLKLMLSIDGEPFPADILSPESIQKMATPSIPGNQPLGWRAITSDCWYRTGTLAGTSAIMVRQDDGISYVVLFNTSTWKGPALSSEIRDMMKRAIEKTDHWIDTDLFQMKS
jgi:CubicO group peptidase (beta-lactamase class C family)